MIGSGALVTFVAVALARLSFGLVLPPMRQALGLSYEQAGHLGTATALGYLALVMVAGALAARRGGRLSILLGLVLATAGFVGLSLASSFLTLLLLMTVPLFVLSLEGSNIYKERLPHWSQNGSKMVPK